MKFTDLVIEAEIGKAIQKIGFTDLTEIQELSIPYLSENDADFIGQAQTGTGKTAAFSIPLLQKINAQSKNIQALVLVPTRELALQVCEDIEALAQFTEVKALAIQGGVSYDRQISSLKRKSPQIIVGTPGRVIDLIKRGHLNFSKTETIVLDEADEMLNMGFLESVQEIFSLVSEERKIWMFSATMPAPIRAMIKKDFNNPYSVAVKKKSLSAESVEQKFYIVNEKRHLDALCRILDFEPDMYGIIFCRTRIDTKEVYEELIARGYAVETLHGDLGQNLRDAAMAKFKKKRAKLMICTDVAARGIDVDNLTHVINYGLPQDTESYIHRVGRTGRAGLKGTAITLADPRAVPRLKRIESMVKSEIKHAKLPTVEDLKQARVESELQAMTPIAEAVLDRGEDFRLDPTYEIYEEAFAELDKEEILKIMFTWQMSRDLKDYEAIGDLNESIKKAKRSPKRQARSRKAERSGRSERSARSDRTGSNGSSRRKKSDSDSSSDSRPSSRNAKSGDKNRDGRKSRSGAKASGGKGRSRTNPSRGKKSSGKGRSAGKAQAQAW